MTGNRGVRSSPHLQGRRPLWGSHMGGTTKMATIGAGSPNHLSNRTAVSIDVGRRKVLRLDATASFASIVAALDEFKPDYLKTYPSVAALLAEEQMGGRLDIRLKAVLTGAEVLTEDRKQRFSAPGESPLSILTAPRRASWRRSAPITRANISSKTSASWRSWMMRTGPSPTGARTEDPPYQPLQLHPAVDTV